MAKPIAGINDYPYGVCGFIVDGAFLRDGTKIKTVRIYKQRSDVMFDLIDPNTGVVYQKVLITGVDFDGRVLDYSKTDDVLVNEIKRNTFFVRGYNEVRSREGFVVRFLLNKVILSTGKPLFDMYTPTCSVPLPSIDNIILSPVTVGDTKIEGTLTSSSGPIDPTDMLVTLTLPGSVTYTTTVDSTGKFVFDPIVIAQEGPGTITVQSPNYKEAVHTFPVLAPGADSEYVTSVLLSSADFVDIGAGQFAANIPASVHGRGTKLVIQVQSSASETESVQFSSVNVADNGDVTITQSDTSSVSVVIIGSTLLSTPYSSVLNWVANGDGSSSATITKAVHGKSNISFSTYEGTSLVSVQSQINANEDLTLTTLDSFTGTIVITGRD